ncbi:MAG: hypothetical protein ACYDG2_17565 [Ruminiclostridium sp.]
MVYRKHTHKSRKYKKSETPSGDHKSYSDQPPHIEEYAVPPIEHASSEEKKNPQPFSFLTSIFGSREKTERSGDPLITIFDYDIYLDDLLLIGLILLIMTDKIEDEILLIILAYLLIDIF